MMNGPKDKPPENDQEIKRKLQIRQEGISADYVSVEFSALILQCKAFLGRPGYDLSNTDWTDTELREIILQKIPALRTYAEYMDSQKEEDKAHLHRLLTDKGKKNVERLDAIVKTLKDLVGREGQAANIAIILALLEEGRSLVLGSK